MNCWGKDILLNECILSDGYKDFDIEDKQIFVEQFFYDLKQSLDLQEQEEESLENLASMKKKCQYLQKFQEVHMMIGILKHICYNKLYS
jgi:hypothetical protein